MGVKRNVTVQLDEDVIAKVKVLAAQRGTSISGLVAAEITKISEQRERYERARQAALAQMTEVNDQVAAGDRGPANPDRGWTREDLHDRHADRWV